MKFSLSSILQQILLLVMVIAVLSGCKNPNYQCIDPDDFGFPKLNVSARGINPDQHGTTQNQMSEWLDSSLVLNGENLVILIRNGPNSQWSAWFGGPQYPNTVPTFLQGAPYCTASMSSASTCPPSNCGSSSNTSSCASNNIGNWCACGQTNDAPICGSQCFYNPTSGCIFGQGVGLYALLVPDNINPNESDTMLMKVPPGGVAFHLGAQTPFIDNGTCAGGWNAPAPIGMADSCTGNSSGAAPTTTSTQQTSNASTYTCNNPIYTPNVQCSNQNNGTRYRLYFKILDRYYDDNAGQYEAVLKSGVTNPNPGPITTIVCYVKGKLNYAAQSVYTNLICNPEFVNNVRLLLILYIALRGVFFAFGMSQMTQRELAIHVFKIALVVQLITVQSSWDFFSTDLFQFFQQGVDELVCLMTQSLTGSNCSPQDSLNYFDDIIQTFTSYETSKKLESVLFTGSGMGFFFVPMFYIVIFIYLLAIFKAAIFYLLSYIALSVLIVLFPVFLVFILFNITKDLFNNWLKQAFNYSIQTMMVLAGLGLMGQVLLHELHVIFGFPVCVHNVWNFPGTSTPIITYWAPGWGSSTIPGNINTANCSQVYVPEYWNQPSNESGTGCPTGQCPISTSSVSSSASPICDPSNTSQYCQVATATDYKLCAPYECSSCRYADLPYLDPTNPDDNARIQMIASGTYVNFNDFFTFFLLVFVLLKFQVMVPEIAKGIAGVAGAGSSANIVEATKAAWTTLRNSPISAASLAYQMKTGRDLKTDVKSYVNRSPIGLAYNAYQQVKTKAQDVIGGSIDYAGKKISQGTEYIPLYGRLARAKRRFAEAAKQGQDIRHEYMDKLIGYKADSLAEVSSMMRNQVLHNISGGFMGKNMHDKANPYELTSKYDYHGQQADQAASYDKSEQVRTKLDGVAERFAAAFGIDQSFNPKVKAEFDRMSKDLSQGSNWAQAAIGAGMLINPLAGGLVAGTYSLRAGNSMWQGVRNMRQMQKDSRNMAPAVQTPAHITPHVSTPTTPPPVPPGPSKSALAARFGPNYNVAQDTGRASLAPVSRPAAEARESASGEMPKPDSDDTPAESI